MLMLGAAQVPWGAVSGDRAGECRGPVPMEEEPSPWTDSLDDMSHVYVPEGGLVNVEVAGGEARLKTGFDVGWIASETITCPSGYRYDLAYLEVDLPGVSQVQISILNASKESSEIGFANETIPPHVRVNETDHPVYDISPSGFPSIRIQVNLVASGADRPRLLAWSLYYVPADEWRDDFLGTGKMTANRGINLTSNGLELDLSRKSGGAMEYLPYPTIAGSDEYNAQLIYPNTEHTGYRDVVSFGPPTASADCFNYLNCDGYLDLIMADPHSTSSQIYWGDETGTFSTSDKSVLTTDSAWRVESGDLNGDGWADLAFASMSNSLVFINHEGTFNSQADISFVGQQYNRVGIGDLNRDGYEDIVFNNEGTTSSDIFYSDADGPDTTKDMTLSGFMPKVKDIDQDGFPDLLLVDGASVKVFLGSSSGPSTTPDYTLSTTDQARTPDAGDLNGDGYMDIVTVVPSTGGWKVSIFEGASDGWISSRIHEDIPHGDYLYGEPVVVDVDVDGYADIVIQRLASSYCIEVFRGESSWPFAPQMTITTASTGGWDDIAVAVPADSSTKRAYNGFFITEPIDLPAGEKWDILHFDGKTPQNTSLKLSILDGSGKEIAGYKGFRDADVDLSDISPDLYRTIQVRVSLMSEFNWTTPVLDRLTVKWMDKSCWRDQFYGVAKVERMLNLGVAGGELSRAVATGTGPQLLLTSLRGATGYDTRPVVYLDGGGLDYLSGKPISFEVKGAGGVDTADINGDGFKDVVFAVMQIGDAVYNGQSPLFLGSPVGWKVRPDHLFPTTGASDLLLADINGDGNVDVVFAQEYDGTSYRVNSTLFWGKAGGGWNATPDVQFATNGASGAVATDLDGDGDLDLAFSCRRDESTTSTNSMVFLQSATGFCGTVPSHLLPTRGAAAVAAGDINGDSRTDLAFANSASGGSVEIDSYIYLGKAGGGFEAAPKTLRTSGAEDVALADVDGDGDLDAVFANMRNNVANYKVDSCIYLNDGNGNFPVSPSVRLPTTGAVAVAVADIDGTGRKDLVFACQYNGTSYNVSSVVYLGSATGWPTSPNIVLPTVGASDVLVAHLLKAGEGGYMSKAITPENPGDTGAFHTFRYTATLGASQTGKVQLWDASTWEVLAETPLQLGAHEWLVRDAFKFKEHQSVRVVATVSGLDEPGEFTLDDLWLNWTPRVKRPPEVLDVTVQPASIPRLTQGVITINVTDEYDPTRELGVTVEHRLNGTTTWTMLLFQGMPEFSAGAWRVSIFPKADAQVGSYDLRVIVRDLDSMSSGYVEFPTALEVRNNVPTAPEVRILPANPITTLTLQASIVMPARDVESSALSYRYRWYCNGILVDAITTDTLPAALTEQGQNWSVELRAFDGLDEGLPGIAWTVILNAPPQTKTPLPNPEIEEDTVDDQWLDLSRGFEDLDGDALSYMVNPAPHHIQVTIDPSTGKVTLRPEADWNGQESATFIASDGELTAMQTVLITVTPVNDAPRIATVNGEPVTSDPIAMSVNQGGRLVITIGATDVEGDELVFSANSTAVQVDEATGTITFEPGNEAVGTLRFALTVYDVASPDVKVRLNFILTVVNVNDPMDAPRIVNPRAGDKFKTNVTFSLIGACTDPDTIFGQVLNFTWWWNGTHLIGYGSSLTWNFTEPGTYIITLNVTDGEFSKDVSVEIIIEPKDIPTPPLPPDGDDGDEGGIGIIAVIGILVVLIIIGGVIFLVMTKRREEAKEAEEEAQEKREAIRHMADEVKATADELEHEVKEAKATKPAEVTRVVIETRGADGQVVVSSTGVPEQTLAVQPKETEAASADVQRLFKDMETREPQVSAADAEAMRLESLKRKYQNAIGRLPYGIPAPELKEREWTWLAGALATGQKKETPDGRELTLIEGRWYFSDVKDASSFLTEHGARPKAEPKKAAAAPAMDKATILAKLEERLVLGEISEDTYKQLRKKYGD